MLQKTKILHKFLSSVLVGYNFKQNLYKIFSKTVPEKYYENESDLKNLSLKISKGKEYSYKPYESRKLKINNSKIKEVDLKELNGNFSRNHSRIEKYLEEIGMKGDVNPKDSSYTSYDGIVVIFDSIETFRLKIDFINKLNIRNKKLHVIVDDSGKNYSYEQTLLIKGSKDILDFSYHKKVEKIEKLNSIPKTDKEAAQIIIEKTLGSNQNLSIEYLEFSNDKNRFIKDYIWSNSGRKLLFIEVNPYIPFYSLLVKSYATLDGNVEVAGDRGITGHIGTLDYEKNAPVYINAIMKISNIVGNS
ncbi:hypothetical protein [Candidatus Nesciobacter abundans]|uniref:Uncharacterized protein n=1 Tax=Candidatus Nesciobacter abundans TaxID=2601668 RepID=A0A5C0UGX5_9PROT|nr:hypothetical protein [Candidatus Nesciobacter abundans]QEK39059.1 hypothetical protein FZC36_01240 [Candidatus Nesciobacter abundans]